MSAPVFVICPHCGERFPERQPGATRKGADLCSNCAGKGVIDGMVCTSCRGTGSIPVFHTTRRFRDDVA